MESVFQVVSFPAQATGFLILGFVVRVVVTILFGDRKLDTD